MRILLAGMLAGDPGQGGATWAVLQYVHGLARLGHDVVVVEPVAQLRPATRRYFGALELDRAALLLGGSRDTVGMSYAAVAAFDAELLINISGMLKDRELTAPIQRRVFLDLDPGFVQIWHAQGVSLGLDDHHRHVSVGGALAATGLPLDRLWIPTVPPVVLDRWPVAGELTTDAFTTVGHWRSYGSVEWRGRVYGQRAHAVRRLLDLPGRTTATLRPALAIHPRETADLDALAAHGWRLADPAVCAATPDAYRAFVAGSKGELGLAKAGYIDSRCGWFSDRSACYLASGRPVVAADTAFTPPAGEGLLAYSDAAEAAASLDAVCADYDRHRRAARAVAEQYLNSDVVLAHLLEAVL